MSSTSTTQKVNSFNKWVRFKNFILGGNNFSKIEKVKVTKLDKLLINELGSKKILLKIDVEGAEAEVLEGSKNILKNCNVVLVQIESSNYKIYKTDLNPESILLKYGFKLEKKFIFPLRNFTDLVFMKPKSFNQIPKKLHFTKPLFYTQKYTKILISIYNIILLINFS